MVDQVDWNGEKSALLAQAVVDSWELSTLMDYANAQLTEFYDQDEEKFREDWENFKEEIDRLESDDANKKTD